MKNIILHNRISAILLIFAGTFLAGCSAIAGIFNAGMWFGIIGVVLVVGIIIWIISKASGGSGGAE